MSLFNKIDSWQIETKKDFNNLEMKLRRKIDDEAVTRGLFPTLDSCNSQNLVLNGFGQTGNNINFSRFVAEKIDTNGARVGYSTTTLNADFQVDGLISVEPHARYRFQYDIKTSKRVGQSLYYPYIASFDVEHNFIGHHNIPLVTFKLGQDWHSNQSQLIVATEDRIKVRNFWNTYGQRATHYLIQEDSYTNKYGYKYPIGKYSRKYYTTNNLLKNSSFNFNTGILSNLKTTGLFFPSTGVLPAGTTVCISIYGATYYYFTGYINQPTPDEWQTVKLDFNIESATRHGVCLIRPGWLLNRNSQAGNKVIISNVGLFQLDI